MGNWWIVETEKVLKQFSRRIFLTEDFISIWVQQSKKRASQLWTFKTFRCQVNNSSSVFIHLSFYRLLTKVVSTTSLYTLITSDGIRNSISITDDYKLLLKYLSQKFRNNSHTKYVRFISVNIYALVNKPRSPQSSDSNQTVRARIRSFRMRKYRVHHRPHDVDKNLWVDVRKNVSA